MVKILMQTKVQMWGNSLAIRLPPTLAREMGLSNQSIVELSWRDDQVILRPVKSSFTLEQLVAGITDDNLHGEVDTGAPVGKESW
jgi:antitoxin MazE